MLVHLALIAIFAKLGKYESRKFAVRHAVIACITGVLLLLPGIIGLNPIAMFFTAMVVTAGYLPMHIHNNYFRPHTR